MAISLAMRLSSFWENYMQQIDTFLAALAVRRRAEQARNRPTLPLPPDFCLSRDLEIAIKYGWFIQPVLARSIYVSASARVGVPDNTRAQIEYWAAAYPDCNWELTLGRESGVMAVQADMSVAGESLRLLSSDDCGDFVRALRFEAGAHRWIALFRYLENIPAFRGLPGVKVLSDGETVLAPPSRLGPDRLGREFQFFYTNPFAPLGDPPQWLLEPINFPERYAESA